MRCTAFLGMSLDGFIAGPNGELDWLEKISPPPGNDMGYGALITSVDALIMGSSTFDVVANFDGPWPYSLPVIVMSQSMTELPAGTTDTELTSKSPTDLVAELSERGLSHLYIDGGAVVASFVADGLLDELIVTQLPVVLGQGVPLMRGLGKRLWLEHDSTEVFDNGFVQTRYRVPRDA